MSQQINLYNPVFLKRKKTFSAVTMLDALALLLVGVAAFYAYASTTTLHLDRQSVGQYNCRRRGCLKPARAMRRRKSMSASRRRRTICKRS